MTDKKLIRSTVCDGKAVTVRLDFTDYVVAHGDNELARLDVDKHTLQEAISIYKQFLIENAQSMSLVGHVTSGLGYVSLQLVQEDAQRISKALKSIGLKNRYSSKHYHFTLQYDKRNPIIDIQEMERDILLNAKPTSVEILAPDGPVPALAIIFESEELQKRFKELSDLGFKYDYDSYLPHITVKYNPEDGDLELLKSHMEEIIEKTGNVQCGYERWRKAKS